MAGAREGQFGDGGSTWSMTSASTGQDMGCGQRLSSSGTPSALNKFTFSSVGASQGNVDRSEGSRLRRRHTVAPPVGRETQSGGRDLIEREPSRSPQQVELIDAVTAVGKPTIAVLSMGVTT